MKNRAYTLAEVLIAIGIIGIASALCLPLANKIRPDESKMICLKTYDEIQQIILDAVNNQEYYRAVVEGNLIAHPLQGDIEWPIETRNYNPNKICKVLANAYGKVNDNCSQADQVNAQSGDRITQMPSFKLKNGVDVWVTTHLSSDEYTTAIIIDVNGSQNGENCVYKEDCPNPDQFKFLVSSDGQMRAADPMSRPYLANRKDTKKTTPDRGNIESSF